MIMTKRVSGTRLARIYPISVPGRSLYGFLFKLSGSSRDACCIVHAD
jgi:hypothetical protein